MSYFKNVGKVLSQNAINSQKKTYILSLKNSIQNPALYYLNQNEPPRDLYQLSLVTYHLARKSQTGKNLLDSYDAKSNTKLPAQSVVPENLVREYEASQNIASQYGDQLASLLRSDAGDLPVHNAVQALFALEALNKSDVGLYEKHLFPVIKQKIQHASLNNLIELVGVLSNIKYYKDKELWQAAVQQLENKFNRPGPQYVKYSAWTLDQYEADEKAQESHGTETEKYWKEVKSSGSSQVAGLKSQIRQGWDWINSTFVYRILQREGRITSTLDNFREDLERDTLRQSLEEAKNNGVNVESVLGRLRPN